MPTMGVYSIFHKPTGLRYVGSSTNCEKRWRSHRQKMRTGIHENELVRRLAAKYGAESFLFQMLERQPVEQLRQREAWWVKILHTDYPKGLNRVTDPASGKGCVTLPATKARLSTALTGQKRTQATRDAISAGLKGKRNALGHHYCGFLTEEDVFRVLLGAASQCGVADLAAAFGVHDATIRRIISRKIWKNVEVPCSISSRLPDLQALWSERRKLKSKKLTHDQVREIRQRCLNGEKRKNVALDYGVSAALVSHIATGRTWKALT